MISSSGGVAGVLGRELTEPIIAYGWQDRLAVADVLVLPAREGARARVFARWPNLVMVVLRQDDGALTIAARNGRRLTTHGMSIVDVVRIVHAWWFASSRGARG
jgi:hypothetical protein